MPTKHYMYTSRLTNNSKNISFIVHQIKKNVPYFVGSKQIDTNKHIGDHATACKIISEAEHISIFNIDSYINIGDIKIHPVKTW